MDALKVELITRDFSRMLEELAAVDPSVEFKDVVDGSAVRVAQGALNRTRAAKAGDIRRDHASREWITFNGRKVRVDWHFSSEVWQAIERLRSERLQVKLNARGTAKQSWLGFASALGRSLQAPAYVLAANYKGRTHGDDSVAQPSRGEGSYSVTLHQMSPLIEGAGMERALLAAMVGETRYFWVNMEQRAFRTYASRASKYPGIFAYSNGLAGLN